MLFLIYGLCLKNSSSHSGSLSPAAFLPLYFLTDDLQTLLLHTDNPQVCSHTASLLHLPRNSVPLCEISALPFSSQPAQYPVLRKALILRTVRSPWLSETQLPTHRSDLPDAQSLLRSCGNPDFSDLPLLP